jgi:hypothetical protein
MRSKCKWLGSANSGLILIHNEYQKILLAPKARMNPFQNAKIRCIELPLFNFVCQLNSAQRYLRIPKCLKPQHRITSLLHLPVTLFNYVIQVLVDTDERLSGQDALDPSQNGGMYDRDAALRHQIAHVAITQLISDIPPHGLNDKKMVEMTAFKEFGLLGRELSHANDYP